MVGTFKTTEQGAATSVWCATSDRLADKGGVFCLDCDIAKVIPETALQGLGDTLSGVLPWAIEPALADRLWNLSEAMLREPTGAAV